MTYLASSPLQVLIDNKITHIFIKKLITKRFLKQLQLF
jgi:hypothetical protein